MLRRRPLPFWLKRCLKDSRKWHSSLARVQEKCEAQPVLENKSRGKEPLLARDSSPSCSQVEAKLGIDKTETIIRMEQVEYADGIPVYEVASSREIY